MINQERAMNVAPSGLTAANIRTGDRLYPEANPRPPDQIRLYIRRGAHRSPVRDVLLAASRIGTKEKRTSLESPKVRKKDHFED